MAHGEASAVRPSIKNLTRAKIFDEQSKWQTTKKY